MQFSLTHTLFGALGGMLCGAAGLLLSRFLLKHRSLPYPLSRKAECLIAALMLFPGAAIGAFTKGLILPAVGLLMLCVCLTVSVTDISHRVIPNETVLAIFVVKLSFGIPTLCGSVSFLPFDIAQSLIGLAACFAVFALPGLFGKKVGAGDIKLAAAMGFFLGINFALVAVMLMGLLVIAYCLIQRKMPLLAALKAYIPMGPFIAAGLLAAYLLSLNIAF